MRRFRVLHFLHVTCKKCPMRGRTKVLKHTKPPYSRMTTYLQPSQITKGTQTNEPTTIKEPHATVMRSMCAFTSEKALQTNTHKL
jgi:hypothetical protein